MCLTVCLRRFAVTDALCAVQDPRKMPGQAAQKRAAKEKAEKAAKMQEVVAAVAWCTHHGKGSIRQCGPPTRTSRGWTL